MFYIMFDRIHKILNLIYIYIYISADPLGHQAAGKIFQLQTSMPPTSSPSLHASKTLASRPQISGLGFANLS